MQMWKFEGAKTLAHFIRKRDCVEQLAYALDVPYECAVPIVMQHVFECVAVPFPNRNRNHNNKEGDIPICTTGVWLQFRVYVSIICLEQMMKHAICTLFESG